ncbi:EF-hand domain-containing protein [Rhodobacter calidifons]|uniref:EF-hand domain-containing protein n=1 Tax=Rhodobacter calidifons TaxID=2715277 RepID=A0ABX0G643_9RHOB|nr:EF-hand domain-containing protein [Rhodobacter calidifons]NHB76365.1 EF-hand domain-containing protein [Rhodobacter calidifons]
MKRLAILLAPVAFASVALAQTTLPEGTDADGNGTWSLAELQAVWTDLTEEGFKGIDTNADGEVDATELQAALDAGVIALPGASSGG